MIRITKDAFETFKRRQNPEVFTEAVINSWIMAHQETIQKAGIDELNEIEKSEVQLFNDEFASFMKVEVVSTSDDLLSKGLKYETFYIREQQIEFDPIEKGEDGNDIEKAKHGKFLDTSHNRKMGRVGAEYGAAKKEEAEKDAHGDKEGQKFPGDHEQGGSEKLDTPEVKSLLNKLFKLQMPLRSGDEMTPEIKEVEKKLISLGVLNKDGEFESDLPASLEKIINENS